MTIKDLNIFDTIQKIKKQSKTQGKEPIDEISKFSQLYYDFLNNKDREYFINFMADLGYNITDKNSDSNTYYKLEWTYANGTTNYTFANTEDSAERKAQNIIKQNNVVFAEILRCESIKVLKDIVGEK
jgi:hypothetical protein